MKKWVGFIFIISVLFLFPTVVLAVDFTINETEIHAYLQENGNVQIEESHTYEFEGNFNGISRGLIPKKGTSIINFEATENGNPLEFELEDEMYKIYRDGEDEVIRIELSYLIEDGVDVYSDMAQFNWAFFDSGNETDYENLTIYIYPPEETKDVIAYGFDEAQGTAKIQENGTAVFQMGVVDSGKDGDIRVAYDSALFSSAAVVHNDTIRNELIAEQREIIEKQESFQDRKDWLGNLAPYIIGAFGLYLFLLLFYAWRNKQNTVMLAERRYASHSIVPKEVMSMPATVYYFRSYMAGYAEMLTVSMMDLVRKGHIEQRKHEEFHLVNRNTDQKHEALLIQLLFDKIGEKDIFQFELLEKYTKEKQNQQSFQEELHHYLKLLREEINSHQLFEKRLKLRWFTGLTSLLLIPLMIVLGIHQLFILMFICLILMGCFLLFAFLFQPRTVKGHVVKNQWRQLKKRFEKMQSNSWYGLSDKDKERALIFCTGLNDKKLAEKNKSLIEKFALSDDTASSSLNIFMLLTMSGVATNSFGSATEISAQSTGVTPGSGTGVGGGGGGSGAF